MRGPACARKPLPTLLLTDTAALSLPTVLNLKVFSHAACDISRVPESPTSLDKLFGFSPIHLEKTRPEDVTSKLHF